MVLNRIIDNRKVAVKQLPNLCEGYDMGAIESSK